MYSNRNLKTDGRWTYTWDAADRLVKMESTVFTQPASVTPPLLQVTVPARVIEFAYDGLSRRIRKKVTEGGSSIVFWEAYVYDGWNMVLSVKLNPAAGASQGRPQSAIASYVWGPDLGSQPFARRDWQAAGGVRGLILANYFTGANGGGLHAPGMDAMGNVTSVTRLGVASTYGGPYFRNEFVYDYDAFGKEMRSSTLVAGLNPDSFPFHYSTKFTDPESGFNYYGYRFYDPANGRWINRDPIGEKGGVNRYAMLYNNCVRAVDRLGLDFHLIQVMDPNPAHSDSNAISQASKTIEVTQENVSTFQKDPANANRTESDNAEAEMDKTSTAKLLKGSEGGAENKTAKDFLNEVRKEALAAAAKASEQRNQCCKAIENQMERDKFQKKWKTAIGVGAHGGGNTVSTPYGKMDQKLWNAEMEALKKEIENKYPGLDFTHRACFSDGEHKEGNFPFTNDFNRGMSVVGGPAVPAYRPSLLVPISQ